MHQRRANAAATLVTLPPYGATRVLHLHRFDDGDLLPARTRSPSRTPIKTMVPCSGAGTGCDSCRTRSQARRFWESPHRPASPVGEEQRPSEPWWSRPVLQHGMSMKSVEMRFAMKSGMRQPRPDEGMWFDRPNRNSRNARAAFCTTSDQFCS